jgi:large subunit ribosomal protein L11
MSSKGAGAGVASATAAASIIKLSIGAGQASAAPPIGPALGQKGVKAIDFCKQFNEATKQYIPGIPLLTQITVKPDRTFSFEVRSPSTSYLLKRAAGISTCSTNNFVGQVTPQQIYEISKLKLKDPILANMGLENVYKMIAAYAHQIGLEVIRPISNTVEPSDASNALQ